MKRQLLFYLFFVLVFLLVSGCNQLDEFSIAQSGNDILFSINNIDPKKDHLMLYDISVARKNCTGFSCVVWELVRFAKKTNIEPENIISLPIKYGQELANMEVRQSVKSLTTGEYVVGATLVIIHDKQIIGSKLVSGSFKISTDGNSTKLVE